MAHRPPRQKYATERRKSPRQERSGATVEAIVEAAARILSDEGPRRLTTNRIARRAGVSVGSLYQYFPNKQAVVRAILERELSRVAALRPAVLDDLARPLAERLRAAVDWHCDVHAGDPGLSRALHALIEESLPEAQRIELRALRSERTLHTIEGALGEGRDPVLAAFVVEVALDALVEAALRRRPAWVASPEFRAELAELFVRYLEDSGAPG